MVFLEIFINTPLHNHFMKHKHFPDVKPHSLGYHPRKLFIAGLALVVSFGGYIAYSMFKSPVSYHPPPLARGNYLHPEVMQETLERLLKDPRMGESVQWVDSVVYDPDDSKELNFLNNIKSQGVAEGDELKVKRAELAIGCVKDGPLMVYHQLSRESGFAKTLSDDLSFSHRKKSTIFFKKPITYSTNIKTEDDIASILYHELFHTYQHASGFTISSSEREFLARHNMFPGKIPLSDNVMAMGAIQEAEAYGRQLLKHYDGTFKVNPSLRDAFVDHYKANYRFIEELSHMAGDEGLFAQAVLRSLPIQKEPIKKE